MELWLKINIKLLRHALRIARSEEVVLKMELRRLRRGIDWACCYPDDRFATPGIREVFVEELRRCADTDLTQLTEKKGGRKGSTTSP